MGAPYVSIRRLADNSMAAMLAAVELYNKPQITYRDELAVMLVVNAWELALKAALRRNRSSIYYPKKPGEKYRTIGLDDALNRVEHYGLWPQGIDGTGVTANVKALSEYRNRAIHLLNARGLGAATPATLPRWSLGDGDSATRLGRGHRKRLHGLLRISAGAQRSRRSGRDLSARSASSVASSSNRIAKLDGAD
ncbi:DUF3644 domain-containing protein [Mycolicibacterium hodleri]|uniref:DUF3644 domain-containing protein n=1 Tax=Mycolicibacterium hodleri TaxID=49897 RepID=UPI001F335667|nr:DUF3644 domain-containing protein [Mycolicibacterium hodleri]